MCERNFPWHLHSIKENETNFLQNEINGPQNVLKLKANEMTGPQNERKIKVNEIIFNQNDRTVKENEIKIKANDMTGPQNVRKFEQNEVMALQNDPTASKMTQRQSLPPTWFAVAKVVSSILCRAGVSQVVHRGGHHFVLVHGLLYLKGLDLGPG